MTIDEPRAPRRVAVVLFDRFELLDVFGPLELFGELPDRFEILLLGEKAGPVRSAQGPIVIANHSYGDAPRPDVVLVPGGIGTRTLVQGRSFGTWLGTWARQAELNHLDLYEVWSSRRRRLVGRLPRYIQWFDRADVDLAQHGGDNR